MIKATDVEYLIEEIKSGKKDLFQIIEHYLLLCEEALLTPEQKKETYCTYCSICDSCDIVDDFRDEIVELGWEIKRLK